MRTTCRYLRVGGALVAGLGASLMLASCGLISSDVSNFDLALPAKKFTIDTGGWQVSQTTAQQYLSTSCQSSEDVCRSAVEQFCPTGCTGSCNEAQACDLSLNITLSQTINLVMEQPELKTLSDEPAINVAIDSVTYEISWNSLDVDTAPLTVYVAPASALAPSDANVKTIGTIAPVAAGETTTAPRPISFSATGKAQLVEAMRMFKTPFNVLIGSSLVVTAGQQLPVGKLDAVVHITGHAGL